ncbi:MAG: ribosome rescue GTPase HflX [Pseudomonadales bacterium]
MFLERPSAAANSVDRDGAILVNVELANNDTNADSQEFLELARAAGAEPLTLLPANIKATSASTCVGSGKVAEIKAAVAEHNAEIVLFNRSLTPSQERNLERAVCCRVLDRTGLILDIFAQRARTHEGKLQVELAQLQYVSTRLIRGWTHLERQKGGIGLRGPGETQLETDRRLLRLRIKSLKAKLERVQKQRGLGLRARRRSHVPSISLVGYTNAGKSTLFNVLTQADVYVADQLFATLDPTLRRLQLPDAGTAVLADTVGFIRDLPHKLVDAFKATLEEAAQADLLLHVVDASSADKADTINEVNAVLHSIGAASTKTLFVYNKIDLVDDACARIVRDENGKPERVYLSAHSGVGLTLLGQAVTELLGEQLVHAYLPIEPHMGRLRAKLFEHSAVLSEQSDAEGVCTLEVRLPQTDLQQLLKAEGVDWSQLVVATTSHFTAVN